MLIHGNKQKYLTILLFSAIAGLLTLAVLLVHRLLLYPYAASRGPSGDGFYRLGGVIIDFALVAACIGVYFLLKLRYRSFEEKYRGTMRFQTLFENSRDAMFIRTADGVYAEVNTAMETLFGHTREEMVGMNVVGIYADPADRDRLEREVQEKGFVRDYEAKLRRKDGTEMECLVNANERRDAKGALIGYEGIIRDITAQKRVQESLRESEERYRLLFDSSPLGIFHYDEKGVIIDCNQKFVDVIGSSRQALLGFNMMTSLRDEELAEQIRAAIEGRRGYWEGNYASITAEKVTPVRVVTGSITSKEGTFLGAVGMVEDVSEAMASNEAYRKSEERFRAIFRGAAMGVVLTTLDGFVEEANAAFLEMTGYGIEELKGRQAIAITHPDDVEAENIIIADLIGGSINRCKIVKRIVRKDGPEIWVRLAATILHDRRGNPEYVLGIIEDITERKRAKEELAHEKEQLAVTLASIGDGVITTDVRGRVVLMNRVAESLTGWTAADASGRHLSEVFVIVNEKTRNLCESPVDRVFATGSIVGLANHTLLIAKDGAERVIADSGAPIRGQDGGIIGVVLVFRDVTEARKTEEELRRAQQLESIGMLAGGIAHDFNNILTSIMGSISLVKMKLDKDGELFGILIDAERASRQARELTQQLLTFSRGGAPIKKSIQIGALLKEICGFSTRGSSVKCEFDIDDGLWSAEVDMGQISQVINNLLINARQAMPGGGVIRVRADNARFYDEPSSLASGGSDVPSLAAGSYVRVEITDQGRGIPQELIGRIFDPYFSTKEKGVGLGLAIAYSIIRRHNGRIEVKSRIGEGTSFTIYLPVSLGETAAASVESSAAVGGSGRVLLMDDDENILRVTGNILRHLGYGVSVSHNGFETIEIYSKALGEGNPYDAVIMDLTIPGSMGGRECVARLLEIDPGAKAVVSSGYSNDPVMAEHLKYGFRGIITKPYRIEELSTVLSRVIGE